MNLNKLFGCAALLIFSFTAWANKTDTTKNIIYVNTAFENASQCNWHIDSLGVVKIDLIYDHERSSPNRANGHWHFQVEATPGSTITVMIRNFDNIWNGRPANPITDKTNCVVSKDGVSWKVMPTERTPANELKITLTMDSDKLYFASVEPYRISDLDRMLTRIKKHKLVHIENIGRTVEGRTLEMIRIGNPNASKSVVLRARAHSWEPGGNWVVEGLIDALLNSKSADYLQRYTVYIMPMANKDGVARGRTRFNSLGMDLNRQWDKEPDSILVPEQYAFERWLKKMVAAGRKPLLAIDLHNDNNGNLHVNLPTEKNKEYTARMNKLESLLRQHTWFREGKSHVKNPGSLGEGLAARYGIDACVYEFNYDWIEGLQKDPMGADWKQLGGLLPKVFFEYFE